MAAGSATATLAGGCFWCTEAVFKQLEGVLEVMSGYTGGHAEHPTYEQVSSGATGHAEAVRILFDPARISYDELLDVFFTIHDPTQINRQGDDIGTQYRSAVYCHSAEQRIAAKEAVDRCRALWDGEIVTEIADAGPFWPAEAYHRDYFARNPGQPYCAAVVAPKLAKARTRWAAKLRKTV